MNKIATMVSYLGMLVIAVLTVLTGIDVVGRYAFNSPLPGAFELTEAIMALAVAFGIVVTTAKDEHINVDALFVKLPAFWQRVLLLLAAIIGVLVFGVMFWKGTEAGIDAVRSSETTTLLHVPISPFKFALAAAFLISVLFLIRQIVRLLRKERG